MGEADGFTTLSIDEPTIVTDFATELTELIIGSSWILENRDPLGAHELRIYIKGQYLMMLECNI